MVSDVGPTGHATEVESGWVGSRTALVVYLTLLLVLPQQMIVGPLGFAGSPATIWGIGCFLWWVWFHVNRVHHVGEPRVVRWAAVAFLAAVLLSYTNAMTAPMAADELSVADGGLLRVASWLGILLMAADGLLDLTDWWSVLEWFVALCGLLALLGAVQSVTGQAWIDQISVPGLTVNTPIALTDPREGHPRPVGTAIHAIEFGQILTMGLLVAASMAMVRATMLNRAAAVLCAVAAVLVLSRSAVLSISVGFLVLASALTRRQRIGGILAGMLVLVATYMVRPGVLGTLTQMFVGIEGDTSTRSRTDSYAYAWHAITSHPLVGKGFGTFLPKYRILDNQWLLSAIEIGIVGILALLVLMGSVVASGFRAEAGMTHHEDRVVTRGCTASVVAVCVGMLFYDGFSFPQATGLLFLVSGMCAAAYRISLLPRSAVDHPENDPRGFSGGPTLS